MNEALSTKPGLRAHQKMAREKFSKFLKAQPAVKKITDAPVTKVKKKIGEEALAEALDSFASVATHHGYKKSQMGKMRDHDEYVHNKHPKLIVHRTSGTAMLGGQSYGEGEHADLHHDLLRKTVNAARRTVKEGYHTRPGPDGKPIAMYVPSKTEVEKENLRDKPAVKLTSSRLAAELMKKTTARKEDVEPLQSFRSFIQEAAGPHPTDEGGKFHSVLKHHGFQLLSTVAGVHRYSHPRHGHVTVKSGPGDLPVAHRGRAGTTRYLKHEDLKATLDKESEKPL